MRICVALEITRLLRRDESDKGPFAEIVATMLFLGIMPIAAEGQMREASENTAVAFMCLLGVLALSLVTFVVTINDTAVLAALFVGIGLLFLGFFVCLIASLRRHEQHYWSLPGTYLMAVAVFGGLALILLANNMNNSADQRLFTAIFYATEVLCVGGALWSNVTRTNLGLGLLLIPLQAITSVLIVYGLFVALNIISRFIPAEEPHSHPYGNN